MEQAAKDMHITLNLVDNLNDAELMVTSKSYYRRKPQKIRDAEASSLPIYVLRKHTPAQLKQMLSTIHPTCIASRRNDRKSILDAAIKEAEEAANKVMEDQQPVELSPQSAYIRRLQHLIAERNNLLSKSSGKDPDRRVRIYREEY